MPQAPDPDRDPPHFEQEIAAISARVEQSRKLDRWASRAGCAGIAVLLSPILLLVAFALGFVALCWLGAAC